MSDLSPRLGLPFLAPAQAQKHLTVNEGLERLDTLVQLVVEAFDALVPPGSPAEGETHALGAAPTGVWAGQGGKLASFRNGGWMFLTPATGWQAWGRAEAEMRVWQGSSWAPVGLPTTLQNLSLLGVATTADAQNRLSVASAGTLFTHQGGGHQLKLNKAAAGDTASLLFQTGFSGRAEMGTAGSDSFDIKVSATGSAWTTALTADAATGRVSLPGGVRADGFALRDPADPTRVAAFSAAGIAAGTTRTYTLPDASGSFATLASLAQVFAGTTSFSAASVTVGTATGAATYGMGTGATGTGLTKAVNLGTGGAAGSTTAVTIGSATAGALGSLTIHSPTVSFGPGVTAVDMPAARLAVAEAGIGGATADATNRLSLNSPATLLNHAGAGHEMTVNKAGAANDAALAFKTGFSARALIGLLGNDNMTVKVSPDGSAFADALRVDRTTARVELPVGLALGSVAGDPGSPAEGWLWRNGTTGQMRARIGGRTRSLAAGGPAILPPAGEHVMTAAAVSGTTLTTLAGAANRIDIFPWLAPFDMTCDQVAVNVTTGVASSQGKVVLYGSDANGRADVLLFESGLLDLSTTGVKSAACALNIGDGTLYWVGIRHSGTATLSAFNGYTTPDIPGGAPVTSMRKTLRRTVTFANPAPANWGWNSAEITSAVATSVWLRLA